MIGAGGGSAVVLDFVGRDGVSKTARQIERKVEGLGKVGDRSGKKIQKSFDGVNRSFRKTGVQATKLQSKFRKLIGLAAGLAAGVQFTRAIRSASEMADQIDKLSIRLGISTEALSQLRFAAELSGVSFNTLSLGMQRMTRRISEAAGGFGEARDALKELNLSAETLNRLSPDQQFERIADALAGTANSADRVRLAMKLFDSEGVALLQVMQDGAAGIRQMRDEADRLGITLTQNMANKIVQARDSMLKLNFAFQAFALNFAAGLSGETTKFAEALAVLGGVAAKVATVFSRFVLLVGGAGSALATFFSGDFERAGREAEATLDAVFASFNQKVDQINSKPVQIFGGGTPDSTQFTKIEEALRRQNALLDVTIQKGQQVAEIIQEQTGAEQTLGRSLTSPEEKSIESLIQKRQELNKTIERQRAAEQQAQQVATQFANTTSSAFTTAIFAGESLSTTFQNLALSLSKMVVQALLFRAIMATIGGIFGGPGGAAAGGGLAGFAHGGSFRVGGSGGTDSQLVAFRASPNETVHVSPPGAAASGSAQAAPVVNVNIVNNSSEEATVQRSNQGTGREQINVVIGQVTKDIETGGPIAQSLQSSFGLRRRGIVRT